MSGALPPAIWLGTLKRCFFHLSALLLEGFEIIKTRQSRIKLVGAEDSESEEVSQVLDIIGYLYQVEERAGEQGLEGETKRVFRLKHSKPVVDQ